MIKGVAVRARARRLGQGGLARGVRAGCVAENLACGFVCAMRIKGVAIWLVGVASGE